MEKQNEKEIDEDEEEEENEGLTVTEEWKEEKGTW